MTSQGIASLDMYDLPHTAAANDMLWSLTRENLGFGPNDLTRGTDVWDIWQSPDLVLSQTCGLPYRAKLHDKVQLVGTPDYGIKGCPAGYYNSVVLVHHHSDEENVAELDGQLMAYNDPLSQSGWAAADTHFGNAKASFMTGPCTGSHAASMGAILTGDADFTVIDALTWALMKLHDPKSASQLRVIETTEPTPALPYITAPNQDAQIIATALSKAIDEMPEDGRQTLHLRGLIQIPSSAYLDIPIPPAP